MKVFKTLTGSANKQKANKMEFKLDLTIDNIKKLISRDAFANIDLAFAEFIIGLAKTNNVYLFLAAAIASYKVRKNHVCADLDKLSGAKFPEYSSGVELQKDFKPRYIHLPEKEKWKSELDKFDDIVGKGRELSPLVLDASNRLFLYKYWNYEKILSSIIHAYVKKKPVVKFNQIDKISDRFKICEDKLDWQMVALFAALRNNFTIITGGPGTGKTTIIISILGLILEQDPDREIAICTPTGKAAARIKESFNEEIGHLNCSENVKEKLQNLDSSTIHRLLGPKYHSPFFKYNRENKLPHDVIIVDESSMIDLPLMTKLLQAVREDAMVILLGDKDQLASVESGAVLNDLCESADINQFSKKFRQEFAKCCPAHPDLPSLSHEKMLNDHIVELRTNYRFANNQGIANLKDAIRSGRAKKARMILQAGDQDLIGKKIPRPREFGNMLKNYIQNLILPGMNRKYKNYLECNDLPEAWQIVSSFKIICSHRRGPYGVERINHLLKEMLLDEGEYPVGLPIMITQNQSDMQLYNGDIGLIWIKDGKKRAFFPGLETSLTFRSFSISQLPANDTVFAMTVHKSQGSGFDKVLLILPNRESPILTRELIYTGITRTRKQCEVWTDYRVFQNAVSQRVDRNSGLKDRLAEV